MAGTVPAKVILQLTTAFRDGGLRNRTGTFFYKDHLCKCDVPILALAGDVDLICPPEAVYGKRRNLPLQFHAELVSTKLSMLNAQKL